MSKKRRSTRLHTKSQPIPHVSKSSTDVHTTRHPLIKDYQAKRVFWIVAGLLLLGLIFLVMGNPAPKLPQDPLAAKGKMQYKALNSAPGKININLPNSSVLPGQNSLLK